MFNRFSMFSKPHEKPAPLTRLQSTPDLKDFVIKLEALRSKYKEIKVIADDKGAQSNEYGISVMMGHLIDTADEEVKKFNNEPMNEDYFLNAKDMLSLTEHIKPILNIPEDDLKILNDLPSDKHYIRNMAVSLTIVAMPIAPFFIYGVGVTAAFCCFSGILSIKPTEDWLKAIKVIDLDTVSKSVVGDYIKTVHDINKNLSKYIETHQKQHDQNIVNTFALKVA